MKKIKIINLLLNYIFLYLFFLTSFVYATVDDDTSLEFYWAPPATGIPVSYKVKVYESIDNGASYKYKLTETTPSSGPYTASNPYKLSMKAVHKRLYKVQVAGVGVSGNIGQWSEESDPVLCYLASQPVVISLNEKWNFISLPVQPKNSDIKTVLSSIDGKYESVWYFADSKGDSDPNNDIWLSYSPEPGYPADLTTLSAGKGYWIYMKTSANLNITNWRLLLPSEVAISLKKGRNDVGYNSLQSQPIDQAFSSITNMYGNVLIYNSATQKYERVYYPDCSSCTHKITPGTGYLIYIKANQCIWDIGISDRPSPPSLYNIGEKDFIVSDTFSIPSIIWGTVRADNAILTQKDDCEVILKDGDKILSKSSLKSNQSNDVYMIEVPATVENSNKLDLYVRIGENIIEAITLPQFSHGEIKRVDLSIKTRPESNRLQQNYPNPFNPDTWIPYQLKDDANVSIYIYSSTGQLIRTLDLGYKNAGFYSEKDKAVHWDGKNESGEYVASGVYFYTIKAGDFTSTRKMVVSK
ncbi:MAG: FlgD immunoglobulin-like domain containing protein [bacterium]